MNCRQIPSKECILIIDQSSKADQIHWLANAVRDAKTIDASRVVRSIFPALSGKEQSALLADLPGLPFPRTLLEWSASDARRVSPEAIPNWADRVGALVWGTSDSLFVTQFVISDKGQLGATDVALQYRKAISGLEQTVLLVPGGDRETARDLGPTGPHPALVLLAILQAREIKIVDRYSRQQRRQAARESKPLHEWHTVYIPPEIEKRITRSRESSGLHVRAHPVRAHPADYTQGKGLFGKLKIKIKQRKEHWRGDPSLGILHTEKWVLEVKPDVIR